MQSLEQKISRIDLNLLTAFNVLYAEKNVSKAAEILYVTQPAMSKSLAKLRNLFDDPLFIRSRNEWITTAKADEIAKHTQTVMATVGKLLNTDSFIPHECEERFSISIPLLIGHAIATELFLGINQIAPKIVINEVAPKTNPFHAFESGAVDFAISTNDSAPENFNSTYIGHTDLAIFGRSEHPLAKAGKTNLESCLNYHFLDLLIDNDDNTNFVHPVDAVLKQRNLKRDIIFASNQLQTVIALLAKTDHLLVGPAKSFNDSDLQSSITPLFHFKSKPESQIGLFLIEHKRIEQSPAHQWMKQQLIQILTQVLI
ncbi:LysR family transcriptional regulator [Thalassomonas sp. M1454]|uniref:LysR family transcriptional regulator n=1 Tax=Thalassomonas sp. M1454 TaxID=2594477 RepID=UPI00117EFFDF|nr:LysR family transcriptional regulator [Thalassomonas sp. M1454]TRX56505.1 LysR family transcriptional regulator [Thalassomonas sp. M1454]